MNKRKLKFLLACVVSLYLTFFIYEVADSVLAIQYAKSQSWLPKFDPYTNYTKVNSVVDQFDVPSIVWSNRQVIFHNGILKISKKPFIKVVYVTKENDYKIAYTQYSKDSIHAATESPLNQPARSPYRILEEYNSGQTKLSRGQPVRITLITGAPQVFPQDGMRVIEPMVFASQHAKSKKQYSIQVNQLQIPLNSRTVFPLGQIIIYTPGS